MSKCAVFFAVASATLLLAGCSREARMYPSNNSAAGGGLIKASFVDYGLGKGPITAVLPDGEQMTGEYSTQDNAVYGFGSIIAQAGSTTASGSMSSVSMGGSQRGVASLFGNLGTTMQCEYFVNIMTSSGQGNRVNAFDQYPLH